MKESKSQIKAQLRNEIHKEYRAKLARMEEELKRHRVAEYEANKKRREAENKALKLEEEVEKYKDWVRRLQEFLDLPEASKQQMIINFREDKEISKRIEPFLFMFDYLIRL